MKLLSIPLLPAAPTPEPLPSDLTCFGIACPLRRTCLRYTAIDSLPSSITTRVTCCDDGTYPQYVYALDPACSPNVSLTTPLERNP